MRTQARAQPTIEVTKMEWVDIVIRAVDALPARRAVIAITLGCEFDSRNQFLNSFSSASLDSLFVSETFQPLDVRLAAKPGHLPLGIVAVGLLGGGDGFVPIDFSAQELHCLTIPQRAQRPRAFAVFLEQGFCLVDQSRVEHSDGAPVDAGVEGRAV